jgi:hypothetical protein
MSSIWPRAERRSSAISCASARLERGELRDGHRRAGGGALTDLGYAAFQFVARPLPSNDGFFPLFPPIPGITVARTCLWEVWTRLLEA